MRGARAPPSHPPSLALFPIAQPEELEEALEDGKGGRGGKRKGKGGKEAAKGPTALTPEQKVDVAVAELEAAKAETAEATKQGVSVVETLEAMLSQADVRMGDVRREAYEFKRDVLTGAAEDTLTGKVPSERVVKFFEDSMRAKEALIDKLRFKNAALKGALRKLEVDLANKEEAGDVLHYIDFHQLQIENAQHLAKIEEKNGELLRLKLTTGNTVSSLNQLKGRLSDLTRDSARLRHDIKARTALLAKLHVDNEDIAALVERQSAAAARLTIAARGAEDMPTTLDYVDLCRTQAAIEHEIASWGRKVEIADLTAKQASAKVRATLGPGALLGLGGLGGVTAGSGRAAGDTASFAGGDMTLGSTTGGGLGAALGFAAGRTLGASFFNSTHGSLATPGGPGGKAAGYTVGATVIGAAARTPALIFPTPGGAGSAPGSAAQPAPTPGGQMPPPSVATLEPSEAAAIAAAVMPNFKRPVGFGSTTSVQGVTGQRPMGAISGAVKARTGFRIAPPPLAKGVGGYGGGLVSHQTGMARGQLRLGRPAGTAGAGGH
jgi:hypothetical protein